MKNKNDGGARRATPRRRLKRITTSITLEELEQRAATEPRTNKRPQSLPLKEIHVAPLVFQWRLMNEEIVADEHHVLELARIITSKKPPKPLDPILVTPVGSRFFVIDGHHRLDAYHTAKWKGPIPVCYLEAPLKRAQLEGLKRNIKNQLPMTKTSKSEAAWRLLVDGFRDPAKQLTWVTIVDATTVDRSTVARMSRVLHRRGEEAAKETWADARRLDRDKSAEEHPEGPDRYWEEWREKKARKLADHLAKGPSLTEDPEITARALQMVSDALPGALVSQWPDEAIGDLRARADDLQAEDAARVVDALNLLDNPYRQRRPDFDDEDLPDTSRPQEL